MTDFSCQNPILPKFYFHSRSETCVLSENLRFEPRWLILSRSEGNRGFLGPIPTILELNSSGGRVVSSVHDLASFSDLCRKFAF